MSGDTFPKIKISRWLTILTIAGLITGMVAGLSEHAVSELPFLRLVLEFVECIGFIWVNLLQLIAIPMIVFLVWYALTRDFIRNMGQMGYMTFFLIIAGLLTSVCFLMVVIGPVLSVVPQPEPGHIEELKSKMIFGSDDPDTPGWKRILQLVFNNPALVFVKQKLWIWLLLPVLLTIVRRVASFERIISKDMIGRMLSKVFLVVGSSGRYEIHTW